MSQKIYRSIEELQQDLDAWLKEYNRRRPHQGKRCDGRTPYATFSEAKRIATEKQISA